MSVYRLHATVRGHVQGVGFRYFVHHTVQRLSGITGYAKNLPDGTVQVEAECHDKLPLDVLLHELHVGPNAAQVTGVDARFEETDDTKFVGFRVS